MPESLSEDMDCTTSGPAACSLLLEGGCCSSLASTSAPLWLVPFATMDMKDLHHSSANNVIYSITGDCLAIILFIHNTTATNRGEFAGKFLEVGIFIYTFYFIHFLVTKYCKLDLKYHTQ